MIRIVVIFLLLLCCSQDALPQKLLPPSYGVYHGAFPDMGPTEDVVTLQRLQEFKELTGKDIVWAYFSDNWFDGIHFPWDEAEAIRQAGAIPFIRMMPRSDWTEGKQDPQYSMQNIIYGKFDLDLHQYARDAKGFGTPLLVEFGTEVNGDWFPWSGAYNGAGQTDGYGDKDVPDGPERFRDAYRHIIDIFKEERVDNVTWFFHVDAYSAPSAEWNTMRAYYPGDDYIDWIGVSVYGAQEPGEENMQFSDVLDDAIYEMSHISLNKPLAILEFGTIDEPGTRNQSAWIKNALDYITSDKYPRIKAISYWHSEWKDDEGNISNMRLDSSPETLKIYRDLISSDFFITQPAFSK